MAYLPSNADDPRFFDFDTTKELGLELSDQYASASPFPHVVIDNFLDDRLIDLCLKRFPTTADPDSRSFDRDQERLKRSYNPDYLHPELRTLFASFNSRPFIRLIENITGIKQLAPDPYFIGGGFHEISNGGHLSVHADFNHHKPLNLERRVNVLIYLNKDWREEYGGQLELWTTDMSERVVSASPIANRCAMFTTTGESMHGNPSVIAHPENKSRKSIALYYYTATWDDMRAERTTVFRARPKSEDKVDWQVKVNHAIDDFVPPILARTAKRVVGKVSKHL
ncbi:MAG: 2OG-Fe(II) oxygenase [Pseudomonadota bacterium]